MGLPGGGANDSSGAVRTPLLQSAASAPPSGSAAFYRQYGYHAAAADCDGDAAAPHAAGQHAAPHLAHRHSCDPVARHRVPSLQDLAALHRHRAWHRRLAGFLQRR
jgi:hypothetical protein